MDRDNFAEGLFLKNYLETVSAVPRARTGPNTELRSPGSYQPAGDHPKYKTNPLANGSASVNNHEPAILRNGQAVLKQQQPTGRVASPQITRYEDTQAEQEERKKERKWTLGGFFRKGKKKDADDSSDGDSGDDSKRGFLLSRRKSKRDRRKAKSKGSTNGFDVVIAHQKDPYGGTETVGQTVEQLWSGNPVAKNADNSGPVRYIHRHQSTGADTLRHRKDYPQVSRSPRKEPSTSRGSGDSLDGKKTRKEVLARAEAKRDMIRDESSSDENESFHSNSSLNKMNGDTGSYRRHRHRHGKRFPREIEDNSIYYREQELRTIKSDQEGSRRLAPPPVARWVPRYHHYPESSDYDPARGEAASPCRSPRARTRHLLQQYASARQTGYPTSTFPPVVHACQQSRVADPFAEAWRGPNEPHHRDQPPIGIPYAGPLNLPRSLSVAGNPINLNHHHSQQLSLSGGNGKSLSYDQDIHKAMHLDADEAFEGLPRTLSYNYDSIPVDGSRIHWMSNPMTQQQRESASGQPAAKAAGADFGLRENSPFRGENRTDPALSHSTQPGKIPRQPTRPGQNIPAEAPRNFTSIRSHSYQHIPTYLSGSRHRRDEPSSPTQGHVADDSEPPRRVGSCSPLSKPFNGYSVLRYYADQNPRSRNPIHITCNPADFETRQQLNEARAAAEEKNRTRRPGRNASDFWRQIDREAMLKSLKQSQERQTERSLKPPPSQRNSDRSRSGSPGSRRHNGDEAGRCMYSPDVELNGGRKTPKEEFASAPEPPVRRLSKQEVHAKLLKCEQMQNQNSEPAKRPEPKNQTEALNELEAIYKDLHLKDEDLVDRAERRDLPVYRPKTTSRLTAADLRLLRILGPGKASPDAGQPGDYQRAVPHRKSAVPDRVSDDMAFRRLNSKDKADMKRFPSQSYLRSSPALSPSPPESLPCRKDSPVAEPDVTLDDVVFRSIRHANSTLKIQDPQPPFGIPIGVIAPAANSDYLHATPKDRFRPTFRSSRTPDVVKDDLAFRNLRKDNRPSGNATGESTKKRAVRSLSANIGSITRNGEDSAFELVERKLRQKTTTGSSSEKQALERKLKELKEERNSKRAEFFGKEPEGGKAKTGNVCWTETKKEEAEKAADDVSKSNDRKQFRSPVVELSKYPAAAPSSSLQGNPFKPSSPSCPVDEDQLENLLSTLAIEAKNARDASRDLEKQLDELNEPVRLTLNAVEKSNDGRQERGRKRRRNLSLSSLREPKEDTRKTNSLERRRPKRRSSSSGRPGERLELPERPRRSLSGARDPTKDREATPDEIIATLGQILSESASVRELGREVEACKPSSSSSTSVSSITTTTTNSSTKEDNSRNSVYERITDLSQILHEVETEQHLNEKLSDGPDDSRRQQPSAHEDVFQEVYEYNCCRGRESTSADSEPGGKADEPRPPAPDASDVELEFDKIHAEVDSAAKLALVDDLIADITNSFSGPAGESLGLSEDLGSSGACPRGDRAEGELAKGSLQEGGAWLACSYALAFAFHLQDMDFVTALGLALAVVSIVAILIL